MSINVTPIPRLTVLTVPAFTLGTAAAAGSAVTAVASNSTLLTFDGALPDAISFGQSGAVGSATVTSRRDHSHAMASETLVDISVKAKMVATQAIANNTETTLTFTEADVFDTDSMHDTSTNPTRLEINTAGKFLVIGKTAVEADSTGDRILKIRISGTNALEQVAIAAAPAVDTQIIVSGIYDLSDSDYVELRLYQNSGSSLDASSSVFMAMKLIG